MPNDGEERKKDVERKMKRTKVMQRNLIHYSSVCTHVSTEQWAWWEHGREKRENEERSRREKCKRRKWRSLVILTQKKNRNQPASTLNAIRLLVFSVSRCAMHRWNSRGLKKTYFSIETSLWQISQFHFVKLRSRLFINWWFYWKWNKTFVLCLSPKRKVSKMVKETERLYCLLNKWTKRVDWTNGAPNMLRGNNVARKSSREESYTINGARRRRGMVKLNLCVCTWNEKKSNVHYNNWLLCH